MMATRCAGRYLLCVFACVMLPASTAESYAFREEPKNAAVQRGKTAVLRCSVDNYRNTTTIAWWNRDLDHAISINRLLKPTNLNPDKLQRYSVIGDASRGEFNLQIRNFTGSDAALYACRMYTASSRETFSRFSRDARLTVAPYDPRCYVNSESVLPMVGDTVNIVCESRNTGTTDKLQWLYKGWNVLEGNFSRTPVVRNVLTRIMKAADYNARFRCFEGSRTCSVIPLRRSIPVLIHTADAQPRVGDTLTYRCVANEDLTPLSYTWYIDDQNIGNNREELTIGPVSAALNGSLLQCVVKHATGFKGNHSVALVIQPAEGGIRTSTQENTDSTRSTTGASALFSDTVIPLSDSSTQPPNPIGNVKNDNAVTDEGDSWDGLLMPFVIGASVVGILLTTVIVLLTVFLSRQRATNRVVGDNGKAKDGPMSPPSDCVPLDVVASRGGNINGSPSMSIGTLKGLRNPMGCGSVDTFELELDPPEYYTLEHNYYEATVANSKQDMDSICNDNQDSGFDGIEVSETVTPDSDLASRNRNFSFGSSPPPPVPPSPVHALVPMVVPPEFEGSEVQAESLVAAYAVTNVARPSPPPEPKGVIARGGSLKRPLPARPKESCYRTPSVGFANERPFRDRRFGSMKSLGEPAVGALARSNSLKRPLPATPRDGFPRGPCTPDPYRVPNSLSARIPPFLTGETMPTSNTPTVPATPTQPVIKSPTTDPETHPKQKSPRKFKIVPPLDRLSAVPSESDYAEIDSDQEATETDSLISSVSAAGRDPNDTQSTVDIDDVQCCGTSKEGVLMPGDEGTFEADYDMVADDDPEHCADTRVPDQLSLDGNHEPIDENTPLYARVKRQASGDHPPREADEDQDKTPSVESETQFCSTASTPNGDTIRTQITDICQERAAALPSAEPPYALVK